MITRPGSVITDVIRLNSHNQPLKLQTPESDSANRTDRRWMSFVSGAILFWFACGSAAVDTGGVIVTAVVFGIGIYLAYLSMDEQRNPKWHLLGLLLLLGYFGILVVAVCASNWSEILRFWFSAWIVG